MAKKSPAGGHSAAGQRAAAGQGASADRRSSADRPFSIDQGLLTRVRDAVAGERDLAEKRMFGGIAMMIGGNIAVSVSPDHLLVRTGDGDVETLVAEPGARIAEMGGRRMHGWVMVDPAALTEDADLLRWVARGVAVARDLPSK